ncbi:pirin family protein [Chitinophagaceae bacterium MMS25-I14]
MEKYTLHPAGTRGHANHGWLNSFHTFSFAGYHSEDRVHFGALRVLNDDTVAGGEGFGKHPHQNMEIITIVLDGALEHKDSMGHAQAIVPGEVQVMSAGTGVYHSEYNKNKGEKVKFLQIWMFPDKENVKPRYDQQMFDAADRQNKLQLLVSPISKEDAGLKIHQDAWIYRTELEKGKSISLPVHSANHGVYAFVISGSAIVNGHELNSRDGLGIQQEADIKIEAAENADILFFEVPMHW